MFTDNQGFYSNEMLVQKMDTALEAVKTLQYDSKYRIRLGNSLIDSLNAWMGRIQQCKKEPFTVVVIGDFKRGKSSIINALLGEEAAAVNVTPETMTMNRISYGPRENRMTLSDGRQIRLEDDELSREQLEKVMRGLKNSVVQVEIRRPNEFLQKIVLIDTPGTGEAGRDYADMVKESLQKADAVLYVYNVMYPFSMSEQLFLKAAVLSQNHPELLLVGNFTDHLETPKAVERVRKMIEERLHDLMPEHENFMVSALDERCRQMGNSRPVPELETLLEGEFDRLRARLNRLYEEKADCFVADRMQRMMEAMLTEMNTSLSAMDRGSHMSQSDAAAMAQKSEAQRRQNIENQQNTLSGMKKQIQSYQMEAQAWLRDFLDRLCEESRQLKENGATTDEIMRYYNLYCIDLLQEAFDRCLDYHREKLYDRLNDYSEEAGRRIAETYNVSHHHEFSVSLNKRIWTKGDTVGLVVYHMPYLSVFSVAADMVASVVAGTMREKEKMNREDDVINRIMEQFTKLSMSAAQTLKEIYQDFDTEAVKMLKQYFAEEESGEMELLEKTMDAARQQEDQKQMMRETIAEARQILDVVQAALPKLEEHEAC